MQCKQQGVESAAGAAVYLADLLLLDPRGFDLLHYEERGLDAVGHHGARLAADHIRRWNGSTNVT